MFLRGPNVAHNATSLPLLGRNPACICNNNQLVVKRIQCIKFIIQVSVNDIRTANQGKQGTPAVSVGIFKLRQETSRRCLTL